VPDVLTYDKQSQTAVDVKKPQIYGKTKTEGEKLIRAEIKKGPYGGKEKQKTGIVTAKARAMIFNRGLGAFSIFSTILAPIRAKKEARQTLKKFGIKREPSVMETLEHTMPIWARPKYYKSLATDV